MNSQSPKCFSSDQQKPGYVQLVATTEQTGQVSVLNAGISQRIASANQVFSARTKLTPCRANQAHLRLACQMAGVLGMP